MGGAPPADGSGAVREGAAFTFILVGDTEELATVDGGFNTKTIHFLAFRNSPPLTIYAP